MISGQVTAELEAVVPLTALDKKGRKHAFEAVIDTGFTGFLSLPPNWISDLGLKWLTSSLTMLGDGSICEVDLYDGTILWEGRRRRIDIDSSDTTPLVGMALLKRHDLFLEVVEGGIVRIERRP